MNETKVYTIGLLDTLAPSTSRNQTFQLNNFRQLFKLRSVIWNIHIHDQPDGEVLPLEMNRTQVFWLRFQGDAGAAPRPLIGGIFQSILIPGNVVYNGTRWQSVQPGQYNFDSWAINEILFFEFNYNNSDLVKTYYYEFHLSVEINYI